MNPYGVNIPHIVDRDTSPGWQSRALCAEVGGEEFFPPLGGTAAAAKKVCAVCPVKAQCLAAALERGERFGVWGGKTEKERRKS